MPIICPRCEELLNQIEILHKRIARYEQERADLETALSESKALSKKLEDENKILTLRYE
jgi:chaperonin cofactor prefoldin